MLTVRRREEVLACHVPIGERNYACYQKEDTPRVSSRTMHQAWCGALRERALRNMSPPRQGRAAFCNTDPTHVVWPKPTCHPLTNPIQPFVQFSWLRRGFLCFIQFVWRAKPYRRGARVYCSLSILTVWF